MQAVTHKKPSLNSPISRPEADSELPKIHGGRPSWRGLRRRLCWGLLGVLVLAVAVLAMRQVYNASFLIDDILEVKEIRGYYTSEKFTIR